MGVGHVQDSVRRWPIITIVLIAINVVIFVITHQTFQEQRSQVADTKIHILMLAATHPGLDIAPNVRVFISSFSEQNPDSWMRLQELDRPFADEWDQRIRAITNEDSLQQEMEALVSQYQAFEDTALSERYAFTPASRNPLAHITASFMHASWKTLLGAMLTLLLAGIVLEDAWGYIVFPAFYLAACVMAMQIHAWTDPTSLAPVMGASGAVAVLMGAVLLRFPLWKLRVGKVGVPAICIAPVWLAIETFVNWRSVNRDYARVFEQPKLGTYAIAVSATFIFGAATAIIFRYLRVERNQSEAARPSMHHHLASEAALYAEQLMEDGNQSGAEAVLKTILQKNPDAVDALMLLQQVHFRKSEMPEYQAVTVKLCQVCVKKRDLHGAWQAYEEYLNSGGQDMPPATWLELSHVAEELQMFDRAVAEYEKIIATLPNTRESLMAQLRAAKILLKQLAQPGQALQMFQGAYSSPIPHLDFEQAIETGIRESKVALSMAGTIPVTD